jgi:hypothetical protein
VKASSKEIKSGLDAQHRNMAKSIRGRYEAAEFAALVGGTFGAIAER